MAEPKYIGYTGKSDLLKSLSSASKSYASYYDKKKKDDDEKARQKAAADAQKQAENDSSKSWTSKVEGFLGGAANSVAGTVEKAVGDTGNLAAGVISGKGLDYGKAKEATADWLKKTGQLDDKGNINPLHLDESSNAVKYGQELGQLPENLVKGGVNAVSGATKDIYNIGKTALEQQDAGNIAAAGKNQIKYIDEQVKAGKLSENDAKTQRDDVLKKVNEAGQKSSAQTKVSDKIDNKQAAADFANTALLLLPGAKSVAGTVEQLGSKILPKAAQEVASKGVGKRLDELAGNTLFGSGASVGSQLQEDPNSTKSDILQSATTGALFGAAGSAGGKLFQKLAKAKADKAAKKVESAVSSKDLTEAKKAVEQVDAGNPDYIKQNGLTQDAQLDPASQQAHADASQAVDAAKANLDAINEHKTNSPYHRAIAKLDTQKEAELTDATRYADAHGVDQATLKDATDTIEAKYAAQADDLAKKHPNEAAQADQVNTAHVQATQEHLDAQQNLDQVTADNQAKLQEMANTPDPAKIADHKQQLVQKQADTMNAVQDRADYPAANTVEANAKIEDITNQDASPTSFNEDGTLKPEAAKKVQDAQVERAQARVDNPSDTNNSFDPEKLANPTTGKEAPNATYARILADNSIPADTKKAITNMSHLVHDDKILIDSADTLVKNDPAKAYDLFDSGDLNNSNPDAQVRLGNSLVDAFNAADDPDMAGIVFDKMMEGVGNAARGTRSAQFISKVSPQGIVNYAEKLASKEGRELAPEMKQGLQDAAKAITKMEAGPEKEAAIRQLLDNAEQKGVWAKSKDLFNSIASLPRTIMTSGDLSFGLRQGAILGARYPKIWAKAQGMSVKMAVDENYFKESMKNIAESKDKNGQALLPLYKKMDLAIEGVFGRSEETFGNTSLAEGKVAKKLVVGQIVAGSDRAFSGAATVLRSDVAKKIINDYGGVDVVSKWSDKAIKDLGKVIDTATGRGSGVKGGIFEKAAPTLGQTLFSARLWKSRLDTLNPAYYARLSPPARKVALQSAASFASVATATLAAASAAGASVETDPRSSDFGKIKVGDTRYDILGGLQQNIVLAARELTGETKSTTTGDVTKLGQSAFGPDRLSILSDFVQNKESPVVSTASTILKGTDQIGNIVNPWQEIAKLFIPLGIQDATQAAQSNNGDIIKGAVTSAPGFLGVGVNTYGNDTTSINISDKAKIDKAPAGEKDQYTKFFQSAKNITGRTTKATKLRDLAKTDFKQAQRKADDFNAQVDQKMAQFYEKYPDMDADLRSYLNKNLYISIKDPNQKAGQ